MKTLKEYQEKAKELNSRFPNLNVTVGQSQFNGKYFLNMPNADKCKTAGAMFPGFKFGYLDRMY